MLGTLNTSKMKNSKLLLLIPFVAMFAFVSCQKTDSNGDAVSVPLTEVSNHEGGEEASPVTTEITEIGFDEKTHNFGEVAMGDSVVHRYTFKNTGTKPLILETVKPGCGCTATNYTHTPIAPGESGFVETTMAAKTLGIFKKSVTVTTNTDPRNHQLEFSGEVVE